MHLSVGLYYISLIFLIATCISAIHNSSKINRVKWILLSVSALTFVGSVVAKLAA